MVHSLHRGRGGRAMMASMEQGAKAGRSLLVLDTRVGDAASRLYRQLGYQEAGRSAFARSADGTLAATLFFYKQL